MIEKRIKVRIYSEDSIKQYVKVFEDMEEAWHWVKKSLNKNMHWNVDEIK